MSERDLDVNPGQFLEMSRENPGPITAEPPRKEPNPWINLLLFVLTAGTTTLAWGPSYSVPLLTILLAHEFGHYFLARKHHVKATLPYFIPAPPFFLLGTFGALIKIRSPFYDRRALLDVGAAGPLAGAIVAIPVTLVGLYLSEVKPIPPHTPLYSFGSSLLFSLLSQIAVGTLPEGYDIFLHPMALAGWAGLLVTSLNLIPVGQLDGGHIAYAMFGGERQKKLLYVILPLLLILGIWGWPGWFLWVGLLVLMIRMGHPPPINPYVPLDRTRRILGWISFVLFILTFTPDPLAIIGF